MALLVPVCLSGAWAFGGGSGARADIVWGCPVPGSSAPTSGVSSVDATIDWELDGYDPGSTPLSNPYIDVDDDGTTDATVSIYVKTDWALYAVWGGWGSWTGSYRNEAVSSMMSTAIDEVMAAQLGIDYSSQETKNVGTGWSYPSSYLFDYDQQSVYVKIYGNGDGSVALPEGSITFGVDVTRTSGDMDEYGFVMDTTGTDGTSTAWPSVVQNVLFLDWDTYNTAALGVTTEDASGNIVPWSTLSVGADVTMIEGDTQDIDVSLGYAGTYAESAGVATSVGHPGDAAIGAVVDCQDDTDPASTPYDWLFAGYDTSAMATVPPTPEAFDLRLDIASDASDIYVDASMGSPPSGFNAKLWAENANVDYDATTDDWVDYDGDGDIDALPHNVIEFTRATDSTPSLDVVFASDSHDTAKSDLYAAFEIAALPQYVSADYAGPTSAVDTDGDGTADSATVAMDVAQLIFCDVTRFTWPWRWCATAREVSGEIRFTVATELPTPDAEGDYPAEFGTFADAPKDITDTEASHFTPDPTYFADYTADNTAQTWTLTGFVTGLEEILYLKSASTTYGLFRTSGIEQFGLSAKTTDELGNRTDVWTTFADLPEVAFVAYDNDETADDGDPKSVGWYMADSAGNPHTTGAAIGVDQENVTGSAQLLHASAWAGTGDGSTDGLPYSGTVNYEVANDENVVEVKTKADMAFEVGLSTSSEEDRTSPFGPRVLRAHSRAIIPSALEIYWSLMDGKLHRLDMTTCDPSAPCPVREPYGIVIYEGGEVGTADDADVLNGLEIPDIPDTTVDDATGNDAFPDFTTGLADYLHAVLRYDPEGAQDDDVTDEVLTWGVEVNLAKLDTAAFGRSEEAVDAFDRTEMCFTAATHAAPFGIGVYTDAKDDGGATWADATHTRASGTSLRMQAEVNIPKDGDGNSFVGNLDANQAGLSVAGYPLLEFVRDDCGDLSDHISDIAPGGNSQYDDAAGDVAFTGRLQVGTEASVAKEQELADPRIGIPATTGIDIAALGLGYSSGSEYTATEGAFNIALPDWMQIDQPWIWICGGGKTAELTCAEEESFDQTPSTWVYLSMDETDGDFGDLDVEYIGDEPCTSCEDDGKVKRLDVRLDHVPGALTAFGWLYQRPRDTFMDVGAFLYDRHGNPLDPITLQYWDDYDPARYGDESESAIPDRDENNRVANFDVTFTNMTRQLYVTGEIFMPSYGTPVPPYDDGDCGDYSTWEYADHVYPPGDGAGGEPSEWSVDDPRDANEIRGMYVHADVDMQQQASRLELFADIRVDGNNQDDDYDQVATSGQRVRVESDETITADVNALLPGMQQFMSTEQDVYTWYSIIFFPLFGFDFAVDVDAEACLDVDIPLHADLDDVSRASVGIDALQGTVSALYDEVVTGGGNIEVAFRERYIDSGGSEAYVDGVWAEEIMAWFSAASWDWFTHAENERKTIGIIDEDEYDRDAGSIRQTDIDTDTMQDSASWDSWTYDGTDEVYGSFLYDPLFHEDVENTFSDDDTSTWNSFWEGIDDGSRTLYDIDYTWMGIPVAWRWELPEIDASATAANESDTFTTVSMCLGEDQDDWGPYATMADGTYFEVEVRHGSGGRIEVLLVGYYPSGDVRFIREMHDYDYGWGIACNKWRVTVDFDTETYEEEGLLVFDLELERKKNLGSYNEKLDMTYVFDASGNGSEDMGDHLTTSSASVGDLASFSGGHDGADNYSTCQWLPGDGTVHDADASDPSTFDHVYDFAGDYGVMQLCYSPYQPEWPWPYWDTVTIS